MAANTSPLAPAPSGAPIASSSAATAEAAAAVRGGGGAHTGFPPSDTQHSAGIAANSAGTCPSHKAFPYQAFPLTPSLAPMCQTRNVSFFNSSSNFFASKTQPKPASLLPPPLSGRKVEPVYTDGLADAELSGRRVLQHPTCDWGYMQAVISIQLQAGLSCDAG